jgi:hypothetical protein
MATFDDGVADTPILATTCAVGPVAAVEYIPPPLHSNAPPALMFPSGIYVQILGSVQRFVSEVNEETAANAVALISA